jgi:hypothetical protein
MSFDRGAPDESEFERRLLAAAREDAGPPDVAGAWARLAGALGPIVSDPALGGGRAATSGDAAPALSSVVGARLGLAAALKWVLLGAVAGSAATAAVLVRHGAGRMDAPLPVVLEPTVTGAQVAGGLPAPLAPSPGGESVAKPERAITPHGARPKPDARSRGLLASVGSSDSSDEAAAVVRPSGLAAEVARLDAARTSNAVGDYDGTVQLVERYHREFPNGALAPDADVVALEAVAAKRDRPETARRAALFLSRYPGDPHTTRVKWLAAH